MECAPCRLQAGEAKPWAELLLRAWRRTVTRLAADFDPARTTHPATYDIHVTVDIILIYPCAIILTAIRHTMHNRIVQAYDHA